MFLCPHCKEPLIEVVSHGLAVHRCSRCKGFIIDADKMNHPHLAAFAEYQASQKHLSGKSGQEEFPCPYDGVPMKPSEFPGSPKLVAPVCAQCRRVWLDAKQIFDGSQAQGEKDPEKSSVLKYVVTAIILAGLFFTGRFMVTWLPGHCEAETLKAICMISGILLLFSLCGIGLAKQDIEFDGAAGFGASRMALAGAIASLGDSFWKILIVFCLLTSIVSFMAWNQHPDKDKNPKEIYLKKKSWSRQARL